MPTAGTGFRYGMGRLKNSPLKNYLQRIFDTSSTLYLGQKILYVLPPDIVIKKFLIYEQPK